MKSINKLNIYIILALAGTLLAGCGHNNKQKEKVKAPATANISIDQDLHAQLSAFAAKPRTKGQFAFCVYDLTADKPVLWLQREYLHSLWHRV
jgi:D-alanyl-D-alanine carboxypeptidase/D-alanyl-D-alanine-endopeptidase (penicillin-binding protein 4)